MTTKTFKLDNTKDYFFTIKGLNLECIYNVKVGDAIYLVELPAPNDVEVEEGLSVKGCVPIVKLYSKVNGFGDSRRLPRIFTSIEDIDDKTVTLTFMLPTVEESARVGKYDTGKVGITRLDNFSSREYINPRISDVIESKDFNECYPIELFVDKVVFSNPYIYTRNDTDVSPDKREMMTTHNVIMNDNFGRGYILQLTNKGKDVIVFDYLTRESRGTFTNNISEIGFKQFFHDNLENNFNPLNLLFSNDWNTLYIEDEPRSTEYKNFDPKKHCLRISNLSSGSVYRINVGNGSFDIITPTDEFNREKLEVECEYAHKTLVCEKANVLPIVTNFYFNQTVGKFFKQAKITPNIDLFSFGADSLDVVVSIEDVDFTVDFTTSVNTISSEHENPLSPIIDKITIEELGQLVKAENDKSFIICESPSKPNLAPYLGDCIIYPYNGKGNIIKIAYENLSKYVYLLKDGEFVKIGEFNTTVILSINAILNTLDVDYPCYNEIVPYECDKVVFHCLNTLDNFRFNYDACDVHASFDGDTECENCPSIGAYDNCNFKFEMDEPHKNNKHLAVWYPSKWGRILSFKLNGKDKLYDVNKYFHVRYFNRSERVGMYGPREYIGYIIKSYEEGWNLPRIDSIEFFDSKRVNKEPKAIMFGYLHVGESVLDCLARLEKSKDSHVNDSNIYQKVHYYGEPGGVTNIVYAYPSDNILRLTNLIRFAHLNSKTYYGPNEFDCQEVEYNGAWYIVITLKDESKVYNFMNQDVLFNNRPDSDSSSSESESPTNK